MKKALLLSLVMAFACGCRGTMTATSTCTFSPTVEGSLYRSSIPGDAKCVFKLESPIKSAGDTTKFADAFAKIIGNVPVAVKKGE